jgi:signal transduction histidine kinase
MKPRRRSEAILLLCALSVLVASICYLALIPLSPGPDLVFDSTTWQVTLNLHPHPTLLCLRPGDRILSIDGVTNAEFRADRQVPILTGRPPHPVIAERNGEAFETWLPARRPDLLNRVDLIAKVAFVMLFWLAGTLVMTLVRPRDERWWVLGFFCHISALFFAAGFVSFTQVGYSTIVARVAGALFMPLAVHLHFLLPEPRWPRLKRVLLPLLYAAAAIWIVFDWLRPIPSKVFYLAPCLGMALSLALLGGHLATGRRHGLSRASRLMIAGIFLGTLPLLVVGLLAIAGVSAQQTASKTYIVLTSIAIALALPNWPLAYLLALRGPGAFPFQIRANRALGAYGFWSLYLVAFFSAFLLASSFLQEQGVLGGFLLATPFLLAAPAAQIHFQRLIDRQVLGIRHRPSQVVGLFAERIPASLERPSLIALIQEQILPTLQIRRSAVLLLRDEGRQAEALCSLKLRSDELPSRPEELAALMPAARRLLPLAEEDHAFPPGLEAFGWLRLIVPLTIEDRQLGFWLFGRRDPDDDYPADDIRMLHALANQIAAVLRVQEGIAEKEKLQNQLLQSQKMEAVGRLSAGVAHDFNNFLSAILGYNELVALTAPADPALREYIDGIREAGEKASALTTQLLAFSRRQARTDRHLELSPLIAHLENLLRRAVPRQVELMLDLEPSPLVVKVDGGHLEQVLLNLVVNAADAMPAGGRLTIRTRRVTLGARTCANGAMPAGTWAQIEVEDDGSGIAPDVIEHIFEPFYTTKLHGEGTGLGLAMVYGMVERSHGFIEVRSDVGSGTCFTISLPVSAPGTPVGVEVPATAKEPTADAAVRRTILVVEDEPVVRRSTAELLRARNFHVLEAGDSYAALELCGHYEGEIHVLLSDVMMPHIQGPELADRLLARRPGLAVVFMSGYNEESLLEHHLDKYRAHLIRKPMSQRDLLAVIGQALEDKARLPVGCGI